MDQRFKKAIQTAQRIVLTTHIHPDADGLGAMLALTEALKQLGKDVQCVCEGAMPERYHYLDPQKLIKAASKNLSFKDIDLVIVTDTNSLERTGPRLNELAREAKNILFVDHHPCPKELQLLHCIDTKCAATSELVGFLINSIGINIDPSMALSLYTGLLIDTSSFRYPRVTGNTHRLAGQLLDTGISPPFAYNQIYGTKSINHLRLLGKILSHSCVTASGKVGWISLDLKMILHFQADIEDTHAFINHLLILTKLEVACMFRELEDGKIKISMRSSGSVDVGAMAQALGGGGHDHSSAAIVDGKLKEVTRSVIKKIELMLGN